MGVLSGLFLAGLSVTGFAATFVFGVAFLDEGVTELQWLGTAFIVASAVIETGRQDK